MFMRAVEIPKYLKIFDTDDELIGSFSRIFDEFGRGSVLLSGATAYDLLSRELVQSYGEAIAHHEIIRGNGYSAVEQIERSIFSMGPKYIIAVGGGKAIDVGKLVAHRWRLPFISVPTQITHDGIASPVAVIEEGNGRKHSLGATMPVAVVTSLATITSAPDTTVRAGIGDLLSNLSALFDWQLAASEGLDTYDDYAAIISKNAAITVLDELEKGSDIKDPAFLRLLIEGLILSGIAMSIAGTSRPCSGAEHLFSHAIDELYGGIALHGIQTALGTLVALCLQGQEELYERLHALYERYHLPTEPVALNLTPAQMAEVFELAPKTRPERYTIFNQRPDPVSSCLLCKEDGLVEHQR